MVHKPVLLAEVIESLNIKENGIYVDLTVGGGGHSLEILKKLNNTGFLYAFDQDSVAIEYAKENLKDFTNFKIFNTNFKNFKELLLAEDIKHVDGFLFDLGLSSFQIDNSNRGFSYMADGPLDMRMDNSSSLTAKDILNSYSVASLTNIFRTYGEEKNSYKIAKEIVKNRPLETTFDLVKITDKFPSKGHSAKKAFQALRIYLNDELTALKNALPETFEFLNAEGILAVISFHSLEDKIVKDYLKSMCEETVIKGLPTLPKAMPMSYLGKKHIKPSLKEIAENPRAHSAILRVAKKNRNP